MAGKRTHSDRDGFEQGAKKARRAILTPGFYLSAVEGIASTWNDKSTVVSLSDILASGPSKLEYSVQANFVVELPWLMDQYPDESRKMMLLKYAEGVRVVIHTANLVPGDWAQKTQGVYMTEVLPFMDGASTSAGEPRTSFGTDLIDYISCYKSKLLDDTIADLRKVDFSTVNVELVASCPGRYVGDAMRRYGHLKLDQLLKKHRVKCDEEVVVGQFSSIGSLGKSADAWLTSEFLHSMASSAKRSLRLIFPCVDDVRKSLEGYAAGASIPYQKSTSDSQPYLKHYLSRWKADSRGRTRASPHIKSYASFSKGFSKLNWFCLTSANLSKAAWGCYEKNKQQLFVRSYELGVLRLPALEGKEQFDASLFPLPYDVPLTKYGAEDTPWIVNVAHMEPDSRGCSWEP